jgi:hypothetical protein
MVIVIAYYCQVYDLLYYDGILYETMVHYGFELYGLITHHLSS